MSETKVYERITRICIHCNKPFSISPAEQKFFEERGMELPKRCSECREKRGKRVKFTCVDCNKEFYLYGSVINFYKEKGLEIPKRCRNCIEDKKLIKARSQAAKEAENKETEGQEGFFEE